MGKDKTGHKIEWQSVSKLHLMIKSVKVQESVHKIIHTHGIIPATDCMF